MATVRYRVDDIPAAYSDAWHPMPTLTPGGATSVRWTIWGAWGTEEVPLTPVNRVGSLSRNPKWRPPSSVAPDWFRPQVAVQDITRLGPPVHWMPLPAAMLVPPITPIGKLGPQGNSAVVMRGRKVGGRRSMHWLRAVPRWPTLSGKAS